MREYDIRSIPTLVMLNQNGDVLTTSVGAMPETDIRSWIEMVLENE